MSCDLIPSLDLASPLVPGIKCLSTDDLSTSISDAAQQPVQVARSASVSNLAEVVSISDLVATDKVEGLLDSLNEYEEQLRRYRQGCQIGPFFAAKVRMRTFLLSKVRKMVRKSRKGSGYLSEDMNYRVLQ